MRSWSRQLFGLFGWPFSHWIAVWVFLGQTPSGAIFMVFENPESLNKVWGIIMPFPVFRDFQWVILILIQSSEQGVMARKLFSKVLIRSCQNGQLNSRMVIWMAQIIQLVVCIKPVARSGWFGWIVTTHLVVGTYSEGSMLHASSLGNQKPDQETRLFCYCSRLDFISTLINSLSIIYYMLPRGWGHFSIFQTLKVHSCFVFLFHFLCLISCFS